MQHSKFRCAQESSVKYLKLQFWPVDQGAEGASAMRASSSSRPPDFTYSPLAKFCAQDKNHHSPNTEFSVASAMCPSRSL